MANKGTLYLVKPQKVDKENVYKFGIVHSITSKRIKRRFFEYGPKTEIIRTLHTCNYQDLEKQLKFVFNQRFESYKGHEWFIGNMTEIVECFDNITKSVSLETASNDNIIDQLPTDTNSLFVCKRCNYTTDKITNLKRHLERKIKCPAKLSDIHPNVLIRELYKITSSEDIFIAGQNHNKYIRNDLKSLSYRDIEEMLTRKSYELHNQIDQHINQLRLDMLSILHEVKNQTNNADASSGTFSEAYKEEIASGNDSTKITINDFGDETLNHLTDEFYVQCLHDRSEGVVRLIEEIHFSERAQENKNIRLGRKTYKQYLIVKNNTWNMINQQPLFSKLLANAYNHLYKTYESDVLRVRTNDQNKEQEIYEFLTSMKINQHNSSSKFRHYCNKLLQEMIYNNTQLLSPATSDLKSVNP